MNSFVTEFVIMGSAATDGPAALQDDGQIQILTVGHPSTEEGESEPVMSCTQSQSKQDLRVTMLKKGTLASFMTTQALLYTHINLLHCTDGQVVVLW